MFACCGRGREFYEKPNVDSLAFTNGMVVCCSVVQCVAVCCSVVQCVAVCGSVWQCVAVCGSVWQCVAVRCNTLSHTATSTALLLHMPCDLTLIYVS